MKPETEKLIYESFREALREMLSPIIEAADRMTDEPRGQAAAMRGIANGCSPLANQAAPVKKPSTNPAINIDRSWSQVPFWGNVSGDVSGNLVEDEIRKVSMQIATSNAPTTP